MMNHPDTEQLVAVEEATQWKASSVMSHIAGCEECRHVLADLESLAALRVTAEPDLDFANRVSRSLRSVESPSGVQVQQERRLKAALDPATAGVSLSAGVIAWLLIVFSSLTHPGTKTPGISAVLFAAIAGLTAAWMTSNSHTTTSAHRFNAS